MSVQPKLDDRPRFDYREARAAATRAVDILRPHCHRIEIAGSLRRLSPQVHDIEIVCIPKIEAAGADLFGTETGRVNRELQVIQTGLVDGTFQHRLGKDGKRACGERFQRLVYNGFPLDVFCVLPPAQWGVILALRTGPARYSKALVTQHCEGGKMLRPGQRIENGQLIDRGLPVETPEEHDLYLQIGCFWVRPENRR